MNLPNRLEHALQKLYSAYNNDTLHPEDACRCAVGNILNETDSWKHFSDDHGSLQLNYVGKVNELVGKKFQGYTPSEILQIEFAFLQGCGYSLPLKYNGFKPNNPKDRNILFDGLCNAIQVLCKLDGVTNCLEITESFEKIKSTAKEQAA